MVVYPNCKINIGLNIIRQRTDGFHDLETVFYPVPWHDILEIIPAKQEEFMFAGQKIECELKDNLCYKAYQLLKEAHDVPPVKLFLIKSIPSGAGLGGGSADAAFTLLALNHLFSLGLDEAALMKHASALGSDCAFFIRNKAVYATGKGNEFSEISLSLRNKYLLIVKPSIHVSTAEAYRMVNPHSAEQSLHDSILLPHTEWRNCIRNDFEAPLFDKYPELKAIREKLYSFGAIYAAMSGSGSALYGLFDEEFDFQKEFPGQICWMKLL